jgi:very-short-patch-repair endonuclease
MAMEGRFQRFAVRAARQHGVGSTEDARATGLSRHQIQGLVSIGVLDRPAPGVLRVGGSTQTWRQRLMVATLSAGEGTVVSHRAAAALHGFDRFPPGPVEVLVQRPHRSRDPRVRVHSSRRLDAVDMTLVDAIPVTTAERTLVDLAARVGRNRLEEALDSGVRDRTVDVDVLRIRIAALRKRGRAGIRKLESLLGNAEDARPTTVLERRFLRELEHAGLPRPKCQVPLRRTDGTLAFVDFLFTGTGVAVEVDGHGTHATRRQRRHDNERANDLTLFADLTILRFTYEQVVHHPDATVSACRQALARPRSGQESTDHGGAEMTRTGGGGG